MNMKDVDTNIKTADFKDLWENKTGFTIRADDTQENKNVHKAFKDFCKAETDNNYTLGLRKLLEYYQGDFKLELLHGELATQSSALADLRGSVIELSKKATQHPQEDEDDSDAF
jgi:hypothetical protein